MISPPISLGREGLSLAVRLYFQALGSAPSVEDASGVAVVELADGDYYLTDLPEPVGGSRGYAVIYDPADPAAALYTYAYGSVPGTSIVWRNEVEPASPVQRIVQHDTYGAFSLVIASGLPEAIADASVVFTLFNTGTAAAAFQGREAVISNVVLDDVTGSYGSTLTYYIQSGDTAVAGSYRGRFSISYPGGAVQTLPADTSLRIEIVAGYDSAE